MVEGGKREVAIAFQPVFERAEFVIGVAESGKLSEQRVRIERTFCRSFERNR